MKPMKPIRSRVIPSVILIAAIAAAASCKYKGHADGEVDRAWAPPQQEEYMGVPAAEAQAAVQRRLGTKPSAPLSTDAWKHVRSLYAGFGQNLLWLDDKGVHQPRVAALLRALANADSEAFRLDAFPLADLSRSLAAIEGDKPTADQLADADVLLSASFTALGEQLLTGQEKPATLAQAWHINPQEEQVDSALARTLREGDLAAGLARMRPQDPGYDSLRLQLGVLRQALANGGWREVPAGRTLGRGAADSPRVTALRARLRAEGYLPDGAAPSGSYDSTLAGAVSDFQTHHNLAATGKLTRQTVDALNVPLQYRLAQIAANMERYRWLPRSLGSRYILVNVPQFKLTAFDSGAESLEMKVIVGKDYEDKATPVFSDSMEFVIFRPYWNVTPTIAEKEVFPKGPEYLAANDMEVYNDHGRRAVRQRPGPKNALGFVKFMFPNDFNIYLHDTPNHELFKKDVRAFSHGCIRVEKPAELAEWVLGWSRDRVEAAMHGSDNHEVNLPSKIPVYIVYFTTYVDGGRIFYGNDLYDRDSKLVEAFADRAASTPETIQAQNALREMAKD
jgi:L,D-transpeptidase YcbB